MITAYIDGDWLLYAAGFAGQKNKYVCPGRFGVEEFTTLTTLRERADATSVLETEETPIYSRIVCDPDAFFFHSVRSMIDKNVDKIKEKFGEDVEVIVLMDGDGNFRVRAATIKPYKGKRVIVAKPLKFMEIKEFLNENYETIIVYGQETDDEMAILQTADTASKRKSIIVSVDKDMLQVPGWHLNPNKGFKKVGNVQAIQRLYIQCLMGDSTDNIGGAWKVGEIRARPAILCCQNEDMMWRVTVDIYQDTIDKYGNHYGGLTAKLAALENMRLVYLRRTEGETWHTPPER